MQFTAGEEYVQLVERAEALLSHSNPRPSLPELHLRALRALVSELERRKYTVTTRPRKRSDAAPAPATEAIDTPQTAEAPDATETTDAPQTAEAPDATETEQADERGSTTESEPEHLRQSESEPEHLHQSESEPEHPRRRGRHIPAAVRREVFARDAGRCTYTDVSGRRCREAHGLELHHSTAFALGGEHSASNLTLRCRAHNALAAEQDFGRAFAELRRRNSRHAPRSDA